MKQVDGQYFSPAPLIRLTPGDLNEILQAVVINYMNSDFMALDGSLRAAVVDFMLKGDNKPWFQSYMKLEPTTMELCYQSIIEEIKDSAVTLCNKVEDAVYEVWNDIAYCEA